MDDIENMTKEEAEVEGYIQELIAGGFIQIVEESELGRRYYVTPMGQKAVAVLQAMELECLAEQGFIEKVGNTYRTTPAGEELLVSE